MEITLTARHTRVPESLRKQMDEKLGRIEPLAPKAQRLEVALSHEANPRQASSSDRAELTLRGPGPVVRAEARAESLGAAFDQALDRLVERLRRAADRRKTRHGRHGDPSVRDGSVPVAEPAALPGEADPASASAADADDDDAVRVDDVAGVVRSEYPLGDSHVVIRDKVHVARPMCLDDALAEMELVGHDFFLFVDDATRCPSVVYRRHGWSYGVIRLADDLGSASRIARQLSSAAGSSAAGDEAGSGEAGDEPATLGEGAAGSR